MFKNVKQLFEFVDNSDDLIFDHIFESAISDVCLYEDEYIIHSLDRYIQMMEEDKVDEKFEENLSNVISPYFLTAAGFYENLILSEVVKTKPNEMGKKPLLTRARLQKGSAKLISGIKKGFAGATKWAKGTKLGKKAQMAYASGLMKASQKVAGGTAKVNKASQKVAGTINKGLMSASKKLSGKAGMIQKGLVSAK
jgi:hypothetical protein